MVPVATLIGFSGNASSRGGGLVGNGAIRVSPGQGWSHLLSSRQTCGGRSTTMREATLLISIAYQLQSVHVIAPHVHRRCMFILVVSDEAAEVITSWIRHIGWSLGEAWRGSFRTRGRRQESMAMGCSGCIGLLGEVLSATYSRSVLHHSNRKLRLQRVVRAIGIVDRHNWSIHARQQSPGRRGRRIRRRSLMLDWHLLVAKHRLMWAIHHGLGSSRSRIEAMHVWAG